MESEERPFVPVEKAPYIGRSFGITKKLSEKLRKRASKPTKKKEGTSEQS